VSLTLDSLLTHFPPPAVLKIDTETHEVEVIKGAERRLREVRPTIWCEVSTENSTEITRLFHAANYKLYDAQVQPHPPIDRA
jgi:Methyltransferase FkbM domain